MTERLPRSVGELLSDALGLFRRHFVTMYLLALPFCAGDLLLREASSSATDKLRALLKGDPSSLDVSAVVQGLVAGVGGLGLWLASSVVTTLMAAGLIVLTREAWFGRPLKLADAFGAMLSRGASLVVTSLLFIVILLAAAVVPLVVPAVLVAVGGPFLALTFVLAIPAAIVGFIFLSLRWGLYAQTAVLEERFGPDAFSRSAALTDARGLPILEGAKFRLSILFIITLVLSFTLQGLFVIPRLVIGSASGWNLEDGLPPLASMPLWFIVPFGLIEVATNALLVPFGSVLVTLFYYDLRVRYEALDLESPSTT
jgi:hypothetical protein